MEAEEYKTMEEIENDHWWFVAKRKFLNIALNKFNANKNLKILDVGCGTGAIMKFFKDKGHHVYGVDMSATALNHCLEKNLCVKRSTAEKINFEDGKFDIVLALDLLEHLDQPETAIKEIKRVLKKNGILIATVPAHQFLWSSYHDGNLHHKKRYGKEDFRKILQDGFKAEKISWIHSSILLPAILNRFIHKRTDKNKKGSDVQKSSKITNIIMGFVYFFELGAFKLFNRLPFGLSLLAVARKND